MTGYRTDHIDELLAFDFTAGSFTRDGAVVDEPTATANGWKVGDTLPITWPDGTRTMLQITGLYRSAFDAGLKTDISVIDPHLDRVDAEEIFVKTAGGANDATRRTLQKALGDSPAITIKDKRDHVEEINGTIGVIRNILYGMLALAVLVAVLGVVNTLAMSVHERAQEIGLLRAVGLDRSGVKLMIRLESLVISLFGGVLGVGLGVFLAWAIGELVVAMGIDTWTLALPWTSLALFLALAALVGMVAALWPARRAANLDILAAIRTE